jgi:hypothetical protein
MNKTNTFIKLVGVFLSILLSFTTKAQSPSICGTLPNTGSNHTVVLDINRFSPKLNGQPLPTGSFIVLQYAKTDGTLSCAGYSLWENKTTAVSANGDDETTSGTKEGYANAEAFKFAVVLANGTVIPNDKIITEFAPIGGIISNGNTYVTNGISALIKLEITTLTCTTLRDTIRTNTCDLQFAGTRIDTFKTTTNCDSIVVKISTFRNSDTTRLNGTSCIRNETGVFTTNLKNRFGCDSIVIKTVTFNPSDTTRLNGTTCNRNEIGVFTTTLKNRFGCDSIVIKTVTFNPSDTTRLSGTSCIRNEIGVFTTNLKNRFGCDSIVIKIVTFNPSDTTRLNGTTCNRNETGVFTTTLKNRFGCDSIVIKTVTFNPSDTTRLNGTTCNRNETGVFTTTLKNRFGCDSIVIKTVTFNPSDTTRLSGTSCIRSETGVFTTTLKNRFGCDSIVIKTVTFNPSDTTRLNGTSCNRNETGVFTTTLKNRFGCDSIVIKTVTFNLSDTTRLSGTSCIRNETGVFTTNLKNRFGCDSIVIKTVTFNPSDTTRLSGTTCNRNETGVFTTKLKNRFGCDSVVIKTVTLSPSDTVRLNLTTCIASQVKIDTQILKGQFCDSVVIKIITYRPALKPTIAKSSDTLISSLATAYQWFRNDSLLVGLTQQKIKSSINGLYKVEITNEFGCKAMSDTVRVVITPRYDCPTIQKNIGDSCDDGKANTTNDKVQSDCTCKGTLIIPTGITLVCPKDSVITIAAFAQGTTVQWNKPTATTTCTTNGGTCEQESITGFDYLGKQNGSIYYISKTIKTWEDAKLDCSNKGGKLIVINDANENAFIASSIGRNEAVFIGLNDATTEGVFKWVDGTPFIYSNWEEREPNNGLGGQREDYVVLHGWSGGKWADYNKFVSKRYILEKPCNNVNSNTSSVSIVQTDGIASGSNFPVGNTTISYRATDACNNTLTCSFTITVKRETSTINCVEYAIDNTNQKCNPQTWQPYALKIGNDLYKTDKLRFQKKSDSTATLTGTLRNASWQIVTININLKDYSLTGTPNKSNCLTGNSSTSNWYYYKQWSGSIQISNSTPLSITGTSPMQIGMGANTQDVDVLGASGNFKTNRNQTGLFGFKLLNPTACNAPNSLINQAVFKASGRALINRTRLDWVENTAKQGEIFIIEKERNGNFERFNFIKSLDGTGTRSYVAFDDNPNDGLNYYKINLIKNDGTVIQSPIIEVNMGKVVNATVYPNPTESDIDVLLIDPLDKDITISLFNILGIEIKSQTFESKTTPLHLVLDELPSGVYQLHVSQKGRRDYVKQVVILR